MKQQWTPGLPVKIEPDRLYAVLRQPTVGYSVGIVIRGEDCNWRAPDLLGHYPLPLKMNSAEANRLLRTGTYEWPAPPVPCKDSHHCERDDCGSGMKEWIYQIKGKEHPSIGLNWAWPPVASDMVIAPDRKTAKVMVEEEYGRTFPTRVLQVDLDSNEFLLTLKEIKADDHFTRRLFEVTLCKHCHKPFKTIEKYRFGNPGGGLEYCCSECSKAHAVENGDYFSEVWRSTPPAIYRITNKATGLCYIGKTRQVFTLRWYQHFFQGCDTKFHRAIKGTAITDWTFEVIEMVVVPEGMNLTESDTFISEREKHHIAAHGSVVNGYNTQGPTEINGELFSGASGCDAALR